MKAKLLLVDDEHRILIVLTAIFGQLYDVYTANDGSAALDILRTMDINVLVSDQHMPGMLGTELLQQAKALKPDTIRILLTGYADYKASMASVNEGEVFRYIAKPWDTAKLLTTVAEAVRVSQQLVRARQPDSDLPAKVQVHQPSVQTAADNMGLLVIGDNEGISRYLSEQFKDKHPVYSAQTLPRAIAALKQHYIGVVITEATVNGASSVKFLAALRATNPTIVTLVLSAHQDVMLISEMINSGQIFRFLPNPPGKGILRLSAISAIRQHYEFKDNPALTVRIHGDMSEFENEKQANSEYQASADDNESEANFFWLRRAFRHLFNTTRAH